LDYDTIGPRHPRLVYGIITGYGLDGDDADRLAADGRRFWIVGLDGDRHWPPLCRAVGRQEWLDDPRFGTARARAVNAAELIGALDAVFATRALDDWAAAFAAEPDVFWSPINSMDDVLADARFRDAGGVVYVPDGDSADGSVAMVATPADFHGTPWSPRAPAPRLGEHTDEVLAELAPDFG
jgi:crotonobetainyl-CoA:carnitine CoA-transferase CaiB-like acyl-CoA transferase